MQSDNLSCGVFVVAFARHQVLRDINFDEISIEQVRKRVSVELLPGFLID